MHARNLSRDLLLTAAVAAVAGSVAGYVMRNADAGADAGAEERDAPTPIAGAPEARARANGDAAHAGAARVPPPAAPRAAAPPAPPAAADADADDDDAPPVPRPPTRDDERAIRNALIVAPYDAEKRDPAWAPRFEDTLRTAFETWTSDNHVTGLTMDALECRTTRCRVVLRYDDAILVDRTLEALVTRSLFDNPCTIHSVGIDETTLAPTHALYFACAGHI
jgi:hypothetical protein